MTPVRLITALLILLLAAPAMAVVVTPAAAVFHTGEVIELSVLNDGATPIHFGSSVPFVLHNLDTDEVFSFLALAVIINLDPGETEPFSVGSDAMTPGNYEIILHYYNDAWDQFTVTANFEFKVEVDVESPTLGHLKLRFRD